MNFKKFLKISINSAIFSILMLNIASAATISAPPNNLGLVLYWSMDDSSGSTVTDYSGNGNTGTRNGAVAWVDGQRATAADFPNGNNAADSIVKSSFDNFPTDAISISFWAKTIDNGNDAIFSYADDQCGNNCVLIFNSPNLSFFRGSAKSTGVAINDGVWHHMVFTWRDSDDSLIVYKDGAQAYNGTATGGQISPGGTLMLGQEQDSTGGGLDAGQAHKGTIDELRVYNRFLSAEEATGLYSKGASQHTVANNRGLVGYWSLNDGSGSSVTDSSGNGMTGDFLSSPVWVVGKFGEALSFDGSDDGFVVNLDSNGPNEEISFGAWFQTTPDGTQNVMIQGADSSTAGDYYYRLEVNGSTLRGAVGSGAGWGGFISSDSGTIDYGEWHHGFLTHNDSTDTTKLYLDGELVNETNSNTIDMGAAPYLLVGKFNQSNSYSFPGKIDDVRIYDRELSASEIQALYNTKAVYINSSQNEKLTDGLVGLWSFNGQDISGATAYDRSGQGNDGTITGATTINGKVGQALNFNGSTGFVNIPYDSSLSPGSDMTMSFWIYWSGKSGDNNILTQESAYEVRVNGGQISYATNPWAWRGSNSPVSQDTWHHVVVTNDADGQQEIYIDGAETFSTASGGSISSQAVDVTIGRRTCCGGSYFDGNIDEVRIYNRALNPAEVNRLYRMGR